MVTRPESTVAPMATAKSATSILERRRMSELMIILKYIVCFFIRSPPM